MKKKALIFGVTGQDGSYLSELLLKKNYNVIGVMRRSSAFNTARIDHLYKSHPDNFDTSYGDLSDLNSIERNIETALTFEKEWLNKLQENYNVGSENLRMQYDMMMSVSSEKNDTETKKSSGKPESK